MSLINGYLQLRLIALHNLEQITELRQYSKERLDLPLCVCTFLLLLREILELLADDGPKLVRVPCRVAYGTLICVDEVQGGLEKSLASHAAGCNGIGA